MGTNIADDGFILEEDEEEEEEFIVCICMITRIINSTYTNVHE